MIQPVNLIEGLQDINITENDELIDFYITRANKEVVSFQVTKTDIETLRKNIKDIVTSTSNLDNYYIKTHVDKLILGASNLQNYYDRDQILYILQTTMNLGNYYNKIETQFEIRNTSNLINYHDRDAIAHILQTTSNLGNYFTKDQTLLEIQTTSNLENYHDRDAIAHILQTTSDLGNYFTQDQTLSEIKNTSNLLHYYKKEEVDQKEQQIYDSHFDRESTGHLINSASNLEFYDQSIVVDDKDIKSSTQFLGMFVYIFRGLKLEKRRAHDFVLEDSLILDLNSSSSLSSFISSKDGKYIYSSFITQNDRCTIVKIDTKSMQAIDTLIIDIPQNRTSSFKVFLQFDDSKDSLFIGLSESFRLYEADTKNMSLRKRKNTNGSDQSDDVIVFGDVIGNGNAELHAMQLCSDPSYIYLALSVDDGHGLKDNIVVQVNKLNSIVEGLYAEKSFIGSLDQDNTLIHSMVVSADAKHIFVGRHSGRIQHLLAQTMEKINEYSGSADQIPFFMTIGQGKGLFEYLFVNTSSSSSSSSSTLSKIEISSMELSHSISLTARLTSLQVSPDNAFIFLSLDNGILQKRRIQQLQPLASLQLSMDENHEPYLLVNYEIFGNISEYVRYQNNFETLTQELFIQELTFQKGGLVFLKDNGTGEEKEREREREAAAYIHNDGLFVGGKLHVNQDLPKHTIDFNGDMRCTDTAHFENGIHVHHGRSHFADHVEMSDDLRVLHDIDVSGNLHVGSHTQLNAVSIQGHLHCSSNLHLEGNLSLDPGRSIIGYDDAETIDRKIRTASNLENYYSKHDIDGFQTSNNEQLKHYTPRTDIPPFLYMHPDRINLVHPTYAFRLGILKFPPEAGLHVNDDTMILERSRTIHTAAEKGHKGSICWDSDYLYICTETDTWKKAKLKELEELDNEIFNPLYNAVELQNSTEPRTSSEGGFLFCENGALKWKGSKGTVTEIAPA